MVFSSILHSHRLPVVSSDRVPICWSLSQHKPSEPIQPSAPSDLSGDYRRNVQFVLQSCTKVQFQILRFSWKLLGTCTSFYLYLCEDLPYPPKLNSLLASTLKLCLNPKNCPLQLEGPAKILTILSKASWMWRWQGAFRWGTLEQGTEHPWMRCICHMQKNKYM